MSSLRSPMYTKRVFDYMMYMYMYFPDAVAGHYLSKPDRESLRRLASCVQRLQAVVARRKDIRVSGLGHGNHRRSSLQVNECAYNIYILYII